MIQIQSGEPKGSLLAYLLPEKAEQYRSLLGAFLKIEWGGQYEKKTSFTEERTEGFLPITI